MIEGIIWWTGVIVLFAAIGVVTLIMLLLLRHAWNTCIFVRTLWTMQKKEGFTPQWKRVPTVWWENFIDPPNNLQWYNEKTGKTHIVYWPTRVMKIDKDDM